MIGLFLFSMVACNNIKGQWRDYAFNEEQIPADFCTENGSCWMIEQFSMEVSKEYVGDIRMQIGEEEEHYIYSFPITAEPVGRDWLISLDNSDFNKIHSEWICDVTGRLMVCDVVGDLYQFRKGKHP